jgi:ABC-2 type transport system permease protein
VVGVYTLVGGMIRSLIQPSMGRLLEGVQDGTLDHTLTKPEDSQLLVSITEFQLWKLVDIVIGAAVLTFAVVRLGERVGPAEAALFGALLLCGGLIVYSVWLAVATSAFWLVRIWSMFDLFDGLYQAGRWPVGIYPVWLRLILTFLVPVAFAVTVPAEALTARLTPGTVGIVLLVTGGFLIGSRWFWKFGLRHYSGASA